MEGGKIGIGPLGVKVNWSNALSDRIGAPARQRRGVADTSTSTSFRNDADCSGGTGLM
jgi:hypothetical protein